MLSLIWQVRRVSKTEQRVVQALRRKVVEAEQVSGRGGVGKRQGGGGGAGVGEDIDRKVGSQASGGWLFE